MASAVTTSTVRIMSWSPSFDRRPLVEGAWPADFPTPALRGLFREKRAAAGGPADHDPVIVRRNCEAREGAYNLQGVKAFGVLDRRPDPLGRGRHVDVADAEAAPQRVHDGVHHGRTRPDGARFAGSLHAERVGGGAHIARLEREGRGIHRA